MRSSGRVLDSEEDVDMALNADEEEEEEDEEEDEEELDEEAVTRAFL